MEILQNSYWHQNIDKRAYELSGLHPISNYQVPFRELGELEFHDRATRTADLKSKLARIRTPNVC